VRPQWFLKGFRLRADVSNVNSPMKILVVDDDPVSRHKLQGLLDKQGYEVLAASNGREAWDVYRQENISVVITDWIMPEIDGLQLCDKIRHMGRQKYTYIILITVMSGKGSYLEGIEAGADDFLTKPFDPDVLRARLHVAKRLLDLQAEVRQLQGLLPICSYCKCIRSDDNLWTQVEAYVAEHSDADFTHGICPQCEDKYVRPQLEAMERELHSQESQPAYRK
jgi:sigma-B regulation protein RsbU (phosphoserine phosphatase)